MSAIIIRLWVAPSQHTPYDILVMDHGERVRGLLAEALTEAREARKTRWDLARVVTEKMFSVYPESVAGPKPVIAPGFPLLAETIQVDLVSSCVQDQGWVRSLRRWVRKWSR